MKHWFVALGVVSLSAGAIGTAAAAPTVPAAPVQHNAVAGNQCGKQGKLRVVKHSATLHAKYRCEKVKGDNKGFPVWNREKDPVRPASLMAAVAQTSVVDPANCQNAYSQHENTHNICASAFNLAPTFNAPGKLATASNALLLQRWWGAGDWDGHWADQAAMNSIGQSTWGFSSARTSYNAYQEADWKVATPVETVGFKSEQGDSNTSEGGTNQASCSGGVYTGCDMDKDWSHIDGDQMARLKVYFRNAPLTIVVNNNTDALVAWQSTPNFSGVVQDARGSTESWVGQKKFIPVTTGSSSAYYIGGYREVDGAGVSVDFQLRYSDTNYETNNVTHVVHVVGQMSPTNTGAQLRSWKADTTGSTCEDNPTGGDAGLTATCSVEWGGTSSWTNAATMVVTLNNR